MKNNCNFFSTNLCLKEGMMRKMDTKQISENKNLISILKGVLISLGTTFVLLVIFAAILTYTNIQESTITPVVIIITAVSLLIGSTIGNRKIQKNGLINGAVVGLIYILILYFISSILNGNFALNISSIIMIIVSIFFGILGGVVAVNKK